MLDMNDGHLLLAKPLQNLAGIVRRGLRAHQFHFSAGKVVVLDVNN